MTMALEKAGVKQGQVVLVHAALRPLGNVPGGAEAIIRALLEVLGTEGTLLMPALSYKHITPTQPVFDVKLTPACVGTLPEYFRVRAGTLRSIHPTHSVCGIGRLAERMLGNHVLDTTPCGPHSPFHILPDEQGYIIMLGCGLGPNTSMHAIEELVVPPYLFGPEITYTLKLPDGTERVKTYKTHGFAGWRQRYDRIEPLLNKDHLLCRPFLQGAMHIIHTKPLWDVAYKKLQEDPFYFVEKKQE
ncbi:MAG: AAC(3) family N-acetyltransferase [Verrucomicrobia bacterium]|nr:AAC(3) family N-acetyltransferase [Verrucomicrobiota bacterium]MBU1734575.1 AAC(3) family N-acetyltransferase [Verrucomicrobiota bacterium]MBU1856228.1 AAC(3) family N-acetyltransferase [Verrucomicrobiota bacterium]